MTDETFPHEIWADLDHWIEGPAASDLRAQGYMKYIRSDHVAALLKAEREKALREAADMLASDAAYWGDEAENASTRHLTEMYSGKAVACQECKDVIEALISEVATKEPSSNP